MDACFELNLSKLSRGKVTMLVRVAAGSPARIEVTGNLVIVVRGSPLLCPMFPDALD